ncbi:hypothetical protein I6A84_11040 [Frankia sp. CNm7]|uniref:Uncharacterized protein n=1 Tax=Frankia nepalensis TaxID=1836974 RepID=A0A937RJH3_9ACTN|nr:hypothetical protein [Frankia nepalensis]MBL7495883.1 hypothetical protein [Frankia nepalensis]MBL7510390.1 hypothetical protein [Frankia nepalensis]MBL7518632.1 hypothetical protein [Frankia nepalensis]MBL7629989.1 hypothetical protein [Frankia nepalensis]
MQATTVAGVRGRPSAERLLGIYLNDHLAGSTAGLGLARRMARRHRALPVGPAVASIAEEIEADRAAFLALFDRLGITRRRYKVALGWLAELVARAKSNGRLVASSPLSSVVELEALRLGVEGKRLGWVTLATIARRDAELGLDPAEFDALVDRAARQADRLDHLRVQAIQEALGR